MQATKTLALLLVLVAMVASSAQAGWFGCSLKGSQLESKCVGWNNDGYPSCHGCCKKYGCSKDYGAHNGFQCHCSE